MMNMKGWDILIVDDEPDNVNVAKIVLDFCGATVHTAVNGKKAMDRLQTLTPTLMLLDLSMPELNGWETIELLRKNPKFKDLPVIAVTAHAMKGDREKVLEAEFDGYISKPFRVDSFLDHIKECIEAMDFEHLKEGV